MAYRLNYDERVSNAGLRAAVERQTKRGETTISAIALFSGYTNKRSGGDKPDPTALRRALGMSPRKERGKEFTSITIPEDKALLIMHALNLDPVDVGL